MRKSQLDWGFFCIPSAGSSHFLLPYTPHNVPQGTLFPNFVLVIFQHFETNPPNASGCRLPQSLFSCLSPSNWYHHQLGDNSFKHTCRTCNNRILLVLERQLKHGRLSEWPMMMMIHQREGWNIIMRRSRVDALALPFAKVERLKVRGERVWRHSRRFIADPARLVRSFCTADDCDVTDSFTRSEPWNGDFFI